MATFTIGGGGDFVTITAALASGSVAPGGTLALLPGYNTEEALVGIENLTFAGDASNTGMVLTLDGGITAINLRGSAPIAVTWTRMATGATVGSPAMTAVTGSAAVQATTASTAALAPISSTAVQATTAS